MRGNYRMAFDRLNTFVISSTILQNLPGVAIARTEQPGGRLRNLQVLQPPTAKPSEFAQPPAFSLNNITVMDRNFETPQTHQWGLSLQHELFSRTVLEVNYIGRRAHNLFGAYNANQVDIFRNGFLQGFNTVAGGGESPLINQLMGADSRRNTGESGSAAMRRLFATDLRNGAVGTVAAALATRVQSGRALADIAGLGNYYFFPYPQFANGMNVIDWPNTAGQNLSRTVALSQPLTVFAVIATDATNAAQHYWFADVTAYQKGTPSTWRLYAGSVLNSGVSVDTSAHTMTSIFNGASSQLFKDGTQIGATSNAGSTGITKISIGGGTSTTAPWDGLIAEVVLYTSALGTSDREAVESYLRTKWGTP